MCHSSTLNMELSSAIPTSTSSPAASPLPSLEEQATRHAEVLIADMEGYHLKNDFYVKELTFLDPYMNKSLRI